MPKTRINCPNCRQPVTAEIDQLFDMNQDPTAKQRLLSGSFNLIQCPTCGFQGNAATPILYHDPEKELLLSFFPPDLTMTRNDQERLIGPLVNQVVNRLPQEKRKGYLFNPQTMLTIQGLIERILEADGITKEMIQAQQQRLNLVQRLMTATDDVLEEIARQEDRLIDHDFFNLLSRLVEASSMQGDRESAQRLNNLQKKLLPLTTAGRQIEEQSREVQAAIKSLQDAGRSLTPEKLLELVMAAPSDTRVSVMVSVARPLMDYGFFQSLSEKIDQADGEEKNRLTALRQKLLDMTQEYDRQMAERVAQTKELIDALLREPNVQEAVQEILPMVDESFLHVLNSELAQARQKGDLERSGKLQQILTVLESASAPPPEVAQIEELLDLENDQDRRAWLESHRDQVTPALLETLTALMAQTQDSAEAELSQRLQAVYRAVLRFSMEKNI
jgi:predicted Zn-dependent protease with MMP-like domain